MVGAVTMVPSVVVAQNGSVLNFAARLPPNAGVDRPGTSGAIAGEWVLEPRRIARACPETPSLANFAIRGRR
jgi:hypothetical protein